MESLYTKYRPQTFADVVGQTHVVTTLERAVIEDRTSHAYLFCGPRGTGKTTMARLLAKALMCERGEGHLPDGTCDQCQLIAAGEHPDVYELDAASRTGVDNVREEIISRVSFAPVRARCKMYIIDEVHMLTVAAFNALLKTLEEPPDHVVFVLCTTDPQKIPETILSRVQRFDFHSIGNADIQARLTYICEREGFSYDEEALALVVRHARGGMRDAISELEQLSVSGGGAITVDVARDVLGEVSASMLEKMSLSMANRDVPSLFAQVESLVDAGRDLLQFARALAGRLRDVYVVTAIGASSDIIQATDDDLPALSREAKAFGSVDRVARALALLSDASNEMRVAPNQRLVLEVALTKIARPQTELTLEALADRVASLERQVAALSSPTARQQVPTVQSQASGTSSRGSAGEKRTASKVKSTSDAKEASSGAQQAAPSAPASKQSSAPQQQTRQAAPVPQEAPQQPASQPAVEPAPTQPSTPVREESAPADVASTQDAGNLQRLWRQAVDELFASYPMYGSMFMNSTIVADDGATVSVSLPQGSKFVVGMMGRTDVRAQVESVVRQVFGPRVLRISTDGTSPSAPFTPAPARQAASEPAPTPQRVVTPVKPAQQVRQVDEVSAQQPAPAPAVQPAPKPVEQPAPAPAVQPAPKPVVQAAPAPESATTPQPAPVPVSASIVQSAPVPAPAVQPAPQPSYPAPWEPVDTVDGFDWVPYDDADMAPYEEDLYYTGEFGGVHATPAPSSASSFAAAPQPVTAPAPNNRSRRPAPITAPVTEPLQEFAPASTQTSAYAPVSTPTPKPAPTLEPSQASTQRFAAAPVPIQMPEPAPEPAQMPAPAPVPAQASEPAPVQALAPVSDPTPAQTPAPASAPAQTPEPSPAPTKDSAPKPKSTRTSRRSSLDEFPPGIISMLTGVFGTGVTYTIEAPEDAEAQSVLGEGYDDADLSDEVELPDEDPAEMGEFVDEPIDDADDDFFEDEG